MEIERKIKLKHFLAFKGCYSWQLTSKEHKDRVLKIVLIEYIDQFFSFAGSDWHGQQSGPLFLFQLLN